MPERLKSWRSYIDASIHNPVFIIEILLVILLIAILYAVTSLRSVTNDLREEQNARLRIAEQNQQILMEIQSCTDPKGACAKRGADGVSRAIGDINLITVYASYCSNKLPPFVDLKEIEGCVEDELAKRSTP